MQHLLYKSGTIKRKQNVDDGNGGYTDSLVQIATVMCRVSVTGSGRQSVEQYVAGQAISDVSHDIYCPSGTNVATQDVIEVSGIVYDVMAVEIPSIPRYVKAKVKVREYGKTTA